MKASHTHRESPVTPLGARCDEAMRSWLLHHTLKLQLHTIRPQGAHFETMFLILIHPLILQLCVDNPGSIRDERSNTVPCKERVSQYQLKWKKVDIPCVLCDVWIVWKISRLVYCTVFQMLCRYASNWGMHKSWLFKHILAKLAVWLWGWQCHLVSCSIHHFCLDWNISQNV